MDYDHYQLNNLRPGSLPDQQGPSAESWEASWSGPVHLALHEQRTLRRCSVLCIGTDAALRVSFPVDNAERHGNLWRDFVVLCTLDACFNQQTLFCQSVRRTFFVDRSVSPCIQERGSMASEHFACSLLSIASCLGHIVQTEEKEA